MSVRANNFAVRFALLLSVSLIPPSLHAANPTITTLTPNSGAVGASVTIGGSNFGATQGTSTVKFNGTLATPTSWSATSIVAPVPAGATTGNVVVMVASKSSNGVAFTVVPAPSISSLVPTSGAVTASVSISGANFGLIQGSSTVKFNGTLATPTNWGKGGIMVPVPSGATTGNVVIHVSGVDSNGVLFTVMPPPSISSLSPNTGAVGASVTISGSNFGASQGSGTVRFGSTGATPTTWSASSIVVPVPSGAASSNVIVHASGVDSNGTSFTVVPAPSVSGLSQTSGPVGTSITISGSNFGASQGSGTVSFNGALATPSSWGASSIVAPVPSSATTGNVVVYASGVNSNAVAFTVTPNITSLSPTSGPVGTSVTITGTSFGATQGASTVKFNGTNATPTGWSDTSIVAPVPSGATSGNVVTTVNGVASNGVNFTVTQPPPPTLVSIAVSPATASVAAGNTQPYTATGTYSDNSTQNLTSTATWTTSDPTVAVIDATGLATAIDNGQVVIQATLGGISGPATLTVTPGQLDAVITPTYQSPNAWQMFNQRQIAIGADGFARIAVADWDSQSNTEIVYIRCLDADCGTSNTRTFAPGIVGCCASWSLAMGPDGFARIAYAIDRGFQGPLNLIQCFDDDCASSTTAFVDTEGGQVDGDNVTSVAVGNDGTSYIVYDYFDNSNGLDVPYLKLATCSGGACSTAQVVQVYSGYGDIIGAAIAIAADGNPVIAYTDQIANQVAGSPPSGVYYYANGTSTLVSNDFGSGADAAYNIGLAIAPDGFARILFQSNTGTAVNFLKCSDTSCGSSSVTPVSPQGYVGGYFSGTVGADGNPQFAVGIGSYPTTSTDLVRCTVADCSTSSIQLVPGNWNDFASLATGQDGIPHILAQVQGTPGPIDHIRPKVPTSLSVVQPIVVLPDGDVPPDGCPGSHNYGIRIDVKYQVMDQESPPQPLKSSGMIPHESGVSFKGISYDNDIGPFQGYPTSGETTISDGTFHDVPLGFCNDLPISNPGATATQDITIIKNKKSYPVRAQTWTVTAPGTASFGHGAITNSITSPGTGSDVSATR